MIFNFGRIKTCSVFFYVNSLKVNASFSLVDQGVVRAGREQRSSLKVKCGAPHTPMRIIRTNQS